MKNSKKAVSTRITRVFFTFAFFIFQIVFITTNIVQASTFFEDSSPTIIQDNIADNNEKIRTQNKELIQNALIETIQSNDINIDITNEIINNEPQTTNETTNPETQEEATSEPVIEMILGGQEVKASIESLPTNFIYDNNGNLTQDDQYKYTYDALNRLIRVNLKSNNKLIASYLYDAQNRRVSKTVGNKTTDYTYAGSQVSDEYTRKGTTRTHVRTYVYGPEGVDDLVFTDGPEGLRSYHKDGLGSVVAVTDEDGDVLETYNYEPYGEVTIYNPAGLELNESAIGNEVLFTGQRLDPETGNYYYKARYYLSKLGRFLTRDPIGYKDGMNLYSYVGGNPIINTDPSGLYQEDFHYYNIYYLGRMAGLSDPISNLIAMSSQYVDDSPMTDPYHLGYNENYNMLSDFHFINSDNVTATTRNPESLKNEIQDALSNNDYVTTGILLHTYADSWSHESFTAWDNENINGNNLLFTSGHFPAGKAPDQPYKNIPKAMEASLSIYNILNDHSGSNRLNLNIVKHDISGMFITKKIQSKRIKAWQKMMKDKGLGNIKYDKNLADKTIGQGFFGNKLVDILVNRKRGKSS